MSKNVREKRSGGKLALIVILVVLLLVMIYFAINTYNKETQTPSLFESISNAWQLREELRDTQQQNRDLEEELNNLSTDPEEVSDTFFVAGTVVLLAVIVIALVSRQRQGVDNSRKKLEEFADSLARAHGLYPSKEGRGGVSYIRKDPDTWPVRKDVDIYVWSYILTDNYEYYPGHFSAVFTVAIRSDDAQSHITFPYYHETEDGVKRLDKLRRMILGETDADAVAKQLGEAVLEEQRKRIAENEIA